MNKEIWIAGTPSKLGGADTELAHNIALWRKYGVDVNVVPMFGHDISVREDMEEIGVKYHVYKPDIFSGKILASWCNGNFLEKLPEIMKEGRPKQVIWANSMTWTFQNELVAHQHGWIDKFIFVSDYQRSLLRPKLERYGALNELEGYRPYFDLNNKTQGLKFEYRPPTDYFGAGRLSRDDAAKYSSDMWKIYDKICTPQKKKVFILGYGKNATNKTGAPPRGLDWMTWSPGSIPVSDFYKRIHVLIHKTGGSRESYSRIVPEAYAAGVPVIVEDDYAYPTLVINGETGFRCKSSDEMSYRASELAFNEDLRKKIIYNAYDFLVEEIASDEKCWAPWERLFSEKPKERPPLAIPDDFDLEQERMRLQQGGCCG